MYCDLCTNITFELEQFIMLFCSLTCAFRPFRLFQWWLQFLSWQRKRLVQMHTFVRLNHYESLQKFLGWIPVEYNEIFRVQVILTYISDGTFQALIIRNVCVCVNVNVNINFNIAFMVTQTQTQRMGLSPFSTFCVCVKLQTLTLTLSVNGLFTDICFGVVGKGARGETATTSTATRRTRG